jgi:hypothetical protein
MTATRFSIQTTFATAAAAVVLSAAQFAGIASLATPRAAAPAAASVAQLPLVVVTGSRLEVAEMQQLSTVYITASRRDAGQVQHLPTVVVTGQAERAATAMHSATESSAI